MGVSTYRDYVLLLPAAKDSDLAVLPRKKLETASAESAGTSHPAVFLLLAPPENSLSMPAMYHDDTLDTWGAVVPLSLSVKGEANPVSMPVQIVFVGAKKN